MPDTYPEKYIEGLRLFNEQEFFECHDVLEELWAETRGDETKFLQALIQVAVAMYHFGNGNMGGARKLYHASRDKLQNYRPHYWHINVDQLLDDFEHCFEEIIAAGSEYPTDVELQDDRIPKIAFPVEPPEN